MDPPILPAKDPKRPHWIVGINYRLRIASFILIFIALAFDLHAKGAGGTVWTLLVLQYLLYPHLVYWRAKHAADSKKAELNNLLLDAFLIGAWVAALHFPLWPSFALWVGCSMNVTISKGWKGLLPAMAAFLSGMLVSGLVLGFRFVPDTVWPTTAMCMLGSAAYLIAVGHASYGRTRQLRATREDLRRGEQLLQQQLTEIVTLQGKLQEQALHDALTGLFNRRYLETIVPHELARCGRDKIPLCLMMMDIDYFKKVNDTYGHQGGDAVLQELATLLIASVRISDVACRYGGEEFLLLLPNMPVAHALLRAEQWRAAFAANTVLSGGASIRATLSIGVACFPDDGSSPEQLIRCADLALYSAKAQGRNRVVLYAPGMAPAI